MNSSLVLKPDVIHAVSDALSFNCLLNDLTPRARAQVSNARAHAHHRVLSGLPFAITANNCNNHRF